MNESCRLLIARIRLWLYFMGNTDAGPVRAWRLVMWYARNR